MTEKAPDYWQYAGAKKSFFKIINTINVSMIQESQRLALKQVVVPSEYMIPCCCAEGVSRFY